MATPRSVDNADRAWLREYETGTLNHFRARFAAHAAQFASGDALLSRYSDALKIVGKQGRKHFRAVDEAHNEICVADAVLSDPSAAGCKLLYEPALPNTDKTVDFVLEEADGRLTLVDVKTIKPEPRDRWDQYERAVKDNWFPENVSFVLEREWLGGELWHTAFASRARFLEYSLELEAKIAASSYGDKARRRILMLCGEGFNWHQDELEDFVSFYRSGVHRADDPLALAEARYIKEKGMEIARAISSFGCLDRRQGDVTPRRINWHVQPPPAPWGFQNAA
jgi:hypothetical protein